MQPQIEESHRIEKLALDHTKLLGHDMSPFARGMADTVRLSHCRKCNMVVVYDMLLPTRSLSDINQPCRATKKG